MTLTVVADGAAPPSPVPGPASGPAEDLGRARAAVADAEQLAGAADRFLAGHAAALRVAALVLSARMHPVRARRPRSAWQAVAEVAPELAEWAWFFAATEGKRDAVRAGAVAVVSAREADDLVRDTARFLALVEGGLRRSAARSDPPGTGGHR